MRWIVGIMMVSVALAGCAGDSYVPEEVVEPCVVVDPTDTNCLTQDELENKTADQVAHQHDYWNGRDNVGFVDVSDVVVDGSYGWCDGGYPIQEILPPDGHVVFQGTGLMNIAMSVEIDEENHNSGPLELWIKRADDDSPEFVDYMEDGLEISIDVNASEADLPHQVLSAWEFWVYAEAGEPSDLSTSDCPVAPDAVVGLVADITKTRDPPVFPGHPDHWDGVQEIQVMDAWGTISRTGPAIGCNSAGQSSHPISPCQMWWRGFGPLNGSTIPPGTQRVVITLDSDTENDPDPFTLGLQYHGANTRAFTDLQPDSSSGGVSEYEIFPENIELDGPYASQSQWRFMLIPPEGHEAYSGTFSVVVTAYDY